MKSKITTFIIGFLVGAIIATSGFLIYSKTVSSSSGNAPQAGMSQQEPPSGENKGETPPDKPSDSDKNTDENTTAAENQENSQ